MVKQDILKNPKLLLKLQWNKEPKTRRLNNKEEKEAEEMMGDHKIGLRILLKRLNFVRVF